MKLTRRIFLTSAGGLAAGAAAGAAAEWALGQAIPNSADILEEWSNYEEQFRVSICKQCLGGCGMLARVVDGRLVRLTGNPLHPVNRGGLCMKGLAAGQALYDPDRIKTPLLRVGKRGEGSWKAIGWEEAIRLTVEPLAKLRANRQAHTVAFLGGQYRGLTDSLFARFCKAYGTPNYLRTRCMAPERAPASVRFMQGLKQPISYDLAHTRYLLTFGCNLLESWQSTVHQQMAYGMMRQRPEGERAVLVVADPRLSVTAAKADRWLPIRPGTDGALALGLASIIIQEGLYDREFVREHTFGFEDWKERDGTEHIGYQRMVLEEYRPEKVAGLTGIPVKNLFEVARGFATTKPAIALGEHGPPFHAHDLYTRMAIHSLNALVGNIGKEGGIVRQGILPLTPFEKLEHNPISSESLAQPRLGDPANPALLSGENEVSGLPGAIERGEPYPLNALFVYFTNPLHSLPASGEWRAALDKVPFIASFSPFMDETTQWADLVLPDHTFLEGWHQDQINHLAGISLFSVGRPVLPPLHDTRQTEDVLLNIAQGLGEGLEIALPWESYQDLLYEQARGLFEAGRGHIVMRPLDEGFEEILARQGYWREQFDDYDDFWEELISKGAWWDPNDTYIGPRQLFATPSHRFEFYSQLLRTEMTAMAEKMAGKLAGAGTAKPAEEGAKPAGAGANCEAALDRFADFTGLRAKGDYRFLPHYPEGRESPAEEEPYPLVLNTMKLMSQPGGRGANQPWLQQQPAVHVDAGWEGWVEINSEWAARNGIAEGDWVWLESRAGRLRVRAKLYPGLLPGVVNMPLGQGHRAYGRWAENRGANPNDLVGKHTDPMRGLPVWGETRVRLMKA